MREKKKEKKLEANVTENIVMKIEDYMVGPNEILQSTDLETYRLDGLVRNLPVVDKKTMNLKFNSDVKLINHSQKLFERLKTEVFVGIH